MKKKKRTNPFYVILIVVGVAFCITAFAYGIMTLRDVRAGRDAAFALEASESASSFMQFMDENGSRLLLSELVILAIATVGAIGTDDYWSGR